MTHATTPASVQPRIALVTGGSRGLGRAAALHLATQGHDVVLTYRTGAGEAAEVAAQIQALGRQSAALPLDMADAAGFGAFAARLKDTLRDRFGRERFDLLLNNAGVGVHAAVAETSEAQFDQLFAVHLKGVFFLAQRLLPLLADGGRILNVSSGLTRFTFPGYGAYAAMKGGVEVLTRYLAKELAPRGITVNTVAPGAVETDFGGGAVRDNPQLNAMIAAQTTLGRAGRPDDIGAAIALLAMPGSSWITGQRIEVSGGMVL